MSIKRNYIIPIFIPHIGCPNDCVFCNQRHITGKQYEDLKVIEEIEKYLSLYPEDAEIELAFYGGSFSALPMEEQMFFLSMVQPYLKSNKIKSIRISTRPDAISKDILDFLYLKGVRKIELGVQSLDEKVLEYSKRGHSKEDVYYAIKEIKKYPIKLGLQMMVGLPLDDGGSSIETALQFVKYKPDFVRIYPTVVIKDTELENLFIHDKFTPLSMDKIINICVKLSVIFINHKIPIIRMGLQSSEDLQNCHIVAGAYHPAFRQLVESELYYNMISEFLFLFRKEEEIFLRVPKKNISEVIGNRKANLMKWKKCGYNNLKVINSEENKVCLSSSSKIMFLNMEEYIQKYYEVIAKNK